MKQQSVQRHPSSRQRPGPDGEERRTEGRAVWGYALVAFLILNALKVQAYVVLDHVWPRRQPQGVRE